MAKSLRDLLLDAHVLTTDLQEAGLHAAAGYMENVTDAIRNRSAYDEAGTDTATAEEE